MTGGKIHNTLVAAEEAPGIVPERLMTAADMRTLGVFADIVRVAPAQDPVGLCMSMWADSVAAVRLAGCRWVASRRMLLTGNILLAASMCKQGLRIADAVVVLGYNFALRAVVAAGM
jgi:hypothetical protein